MAVHTPSTELGRLVGDALGPLPRVAAESVLLDLERARMGREDNRALCQLTERHNLVFINSSRLVMRLEDLEHANKSLRRQNERMREELHDAEAENSQLRYDVGIIERVRQKLAEVIMITDVTRAATRVRDPPESEEDLRQTLADVRDLLEEDLRPTLADVRDLLEDVNHVLHPNGRRPEFEERGDIEVGWSLPPFQFR